MSIERLLEEIVHIGRLSPVDELELVYDVWFLLLNANEVKDKWERIKTMSSIRFCSAIVASGERKGDMCGKLLKDPDATYCASHLHYKPPARPETKEDEAMPPKSSRDNIIIRQNRHNNFVFPQTQLILDQNNMVVAKEGENGEWLPLEKSDIKQAKKLHLRYKILDSHFKGERFPQSIADYMSKPLEEKQSMSEVFYPGDLFVSRPSINPDRQPLIEDDL